MSKGTKPSLIMCFLNETALPPICWWRILRGHQWKAKPEKATVA